MSRTKSRDRRLAVQKLETRKVFATVSFFPATQIVELVEDVAERNQVTVNGHAGKIILKDKAGIKISNDSRFFITRVSNTEVHVVGKQVQKIKLDLGLKNDRVVAGGSRVGTVMNLGQGNDYVVSGSKADDLIDGGSGDDYIRGYGGDDVLIGGDGDDILRGFSGNNTLIGGKGMTTLRAGTAMTDSKEVREMTSSMEEEVMIRWTVGLVMMCFGAAQVPTKWREVRGMICSLHH